MSLTAREIARQVSHGIVTAETIARAALDRIEAGNSELNAFVHIDAERTLSEARLIDRRIADGETLSLAGVPFGVKDTIWVRGRRIANGSRLFAEFVPDRDAIAVERLRQQGAVVVGITNSPEFASKGHTDSPFHGPTLHPADTALTPGGSSGGSASAVAAGMVPLALGTDSGGSVRRPAAHVGVCGFKPTYGAIPAGPGFVTPRIGVSVVGFLAETMDGLSLAFEAASGFHADDSDSMDVPPARTGIDRLRVAYSAKFGLPTPMDDDVTDAMNVAIARLRSGGMSIDEKDPDWPDGATEDAVMAMHFAGLAAIYGERWKATPELFDPAIGAQIERGVGMTGVEVAASQLLGEDIAKHVAAFFTEYDILVGPTTPCVAWPADLPGPATIGGHATEERGSAIFTPFFNHARAPAISLPAGTGRDGLPVGLQLVAARGQDRTLLTFCEGVEGELTPSP